jgi:hypothetical protein
MHQLRRVGIVVDIDDNLLPFLEPQQRSRELAVIEGGLTAGSKASAVTIRVPS